jgi:hypothetical protein
VHNGSTRGTELRHVLMECWSHKPLASNMSLPLMLGMLKEASETLGPQKDNTHASGLKYVVRFVHLGHLC